MFEQPQPQMIAGRQGLAEDEAIIVSRWPFSITIAIPAFNEADGIADVIGDVRRIVPEAEVLVIADGSSDATPEIAANAGARVVRHPYNKGNGASVKTAIRQASGEVLLIIDADGQHNPEDIPRLLDYMDTYDMAVGVRSRDSHASRTRGIGNWLLDRFASYVAGMDLDDLTSGFRAMRRSIALEFIHLLPNRYSWPTTTMLSFAKAGYSIKFVPIAARPRAGGKSGQTLFRNGIKFGTIILRIVMLFNPLRIMFPIGLVLLGLSIVGYLLSLLAGGPPLHLPGSTVMFFVGAIVIWMFGLLAEQIVAVGLGKRQ